MEVAYSQFLAPMPRRDTQGLQPCSCGFTSMGLSPSTAGRSRPFRLQPRGSGRALQHYIPRRFPVRVRFGLFPFRSPLIWESQFGFFSSSYLDASVRRVPPPIWECRRCDPRREVPLGYLRIEGCVRLPGAYRSLPRPSSAPKPSHSSGGVSCRAL